MDAELSATIELLKKKIQQEHAKKIDNFMLKELVQLLHYFKLAIKCLKPFNTPTIHLVGMWKAELKVHL